MEPELLAAARGGPLSINVLCAPDGAPERAAPRAAAARAIHRARDGTTEALYTAPDCAEYERLLRQVPGQFAYVTGSERSICGSAARADE